MYDEQKSTYVSSCKNTPDVELCFASLIPQAPWLQLSLPQKLNLANRNTIVCIIILLQY